MVIPGDGWPDSAKGRFPEASDASLNYLFRGVQKRYSDTQYKDFQPRVGLAYQISPRNVFRAGIGRFFTRLGVSVGLLLDPGQVGQPRLHLRILGHGQGPGLEARGVVAGEGGEVAVALGDGSVHLHVRTPASRPPRPRAAGADAPGPRPA